MKQVSILHYISSRWFGRGPTPQHPSGASKHTDRAKTIYYSGWFFNRFCNGWKEYEKAEKEIKKKQPSTAAVAE